MVTTSHNKATVTNAAVTNATVTCTRVYVLRVRVMHRRFRDVFRSEHTLVFDLPLLLFLLYIVIIHHTEFAVHMESQFGVYNCNCNSP